MSSMTFDDMTVHNGSYGARFESWEGDQGLIQIPSVPTANAPFPIVVTPNSLKKPYAFRNTVLSPASSFSQYRSLLSQSFGQRFSLGTAGEPPKKRKSVSVSIFDITPKVSRWYVLTLGAKFPYKIPCICKATQNWCIRLEPNIFMIDE